MKRSTNAETWSLARGYNGTRKFVSLHEQLNVPQRTFSCSFFHPADRWQSSELSETPIAGWKVHGFVGWYMDDEMETSANRRMEYLFKVMPPLNCSLAKAVLCLFLFACIASQSLAETITLRPVADTSLFGDDPTNNLGGELSIPVGATDDTTGKTNRGLVKFDVASAVPSNVTVLAASLTVTVVQAPTVRSIDSIFSLRRLLRSWGEGNKRSTNTFKNGAPATAGEATWIHRSYPDGLWSGPGAGGVADATS